MAKNIYGLDVTRAYELSWLNLNGKPQLGVVEIIQDHAKSAVEPLEPLDTRVYKQLLESFNNQPYADVLTVKKLIATNLVKLCPSMASCDLNLVPAKNFADYVFLENQTIAGFNFMCIQGLRFICDKTDQPFIGTFFLYAIDKPNIDENVIRDILLQFRNIKLTPQQFVEQLYLEIQNCINNNFVMSVNLNRRGGISYQGIRSNHPDNLRKFIYRSILE